MTGFAGASVSTRRVVMFVYGDISHDSRVLREAAALATAGHEVVVIARPADPLASQGHVERRDGFEIRAVPGPGGWRRPWWILGLPLRIVARIADRVRPALHAESTLAWLVIWRFAVGGWGRAAAAAAPAADVYHGHDLTGLAPAVQASRLHGGLVVDDSHEILLESGAYSRRPAWVRRRITRTERHLLVECSAIVSVNDALLAELGRRYVIPDLAVAIHNCPPRWDPPPIPDGRLRAALGVDADIPVAMYHGSFGPERGLEQLAEAILEPGLEAVHAAFLGYGSQRARLERLAAEPRFGGRLHVVDAVPPDELLGWISGADVDVMALQPTTLNHRLSTPNKLFEAIAAGVPVVASDFPAMQAIVCDDPSGPLGDVCDPTRPAAIAAAIRRIIEAPAEERLELRRRCRFAANERWNWETESAKLVEVYAELAGSIGPAGPAR
jgi:glycosyltransferase involved in cell wall biosynthesis